MQFCYICKCVFKKIKNLHSVSLHMQIVPNLIALQYLQFYIQITHGGYLWVKKIGINSRDCVIVRGKDIIFWKNTYMYGLHNYAFCLQNRKRQQSNKTDQQPPQPQKKQKNEKKETVYCLCQKPAFGDMVGCDNHCWMDWFHYHCVNLRWV